MTVEIMNIWSPAHQAIENGDADELSRLLDSGVDPDQISGGMTLLIHAIDYEADTAIQGNCEMGASLTAVILAYGASSQLQTSEGQSPLEFADEYGHMVAKRLIVRFGGS